MKEFLAKIADCHSLSQAESFAAFDMLFSGEATQAQIGAFLMGLRVKGETIDEIKGAVTAMRAKMLPVSAPSNAVDVVGTGGDSSGSYNISTLASFIVAGAGSVVAKHGNRALSSKSGAADCLQALGVNVNITPQKVSDCIEKVGIGFMFAPTHHPAMKHVGNARAELGTRTIFNILGPLSNPASVKHQLIGVFSPKWLKPVAQTLRDLGSKSVWVVHGNGIDEVTGTGETQVVALENEDLREFSISPADFGFNLCTSLDLNGGDAAHNAKALLAVLKGQSGAYKEVAVMNAACALMVAGIAQNIQEATAMALESLATGAALLKLEQLIEVSND